MVDDEIFDDELERIRTAKKKDLERKLRDSGRPHILTITDRDFARVVQEHPYVLIDFWAEWCGPCRMVSPAVEELAVEFADRLTVGKVNTDENPLVSRKFSITAIPTLMLFSHGQMVDRIIGAYPKETIRKRIQRIL